jgi:hypothetical protein
MKILFKGLPPSMAAVILAVCSFFFLHTACMHSLLFCVCVRMAFNNLKAAHPDAHIGTKRLGSKPLVCFLGEAWDAAGSEHSRLRSLLLDLVRGQDVSKVRG